MAQTPLSADRFRSPPDRLSAGRHRSRMLRDRQPPLPPADGGPGLPAEEAEPPGHELEM